MTRSDARPRDLPDQTPLTMSNLARVAARNSDVPGPVAVACQVPEFVAADAAPREEAGGHPMTVGDAAKAAPMKIG